MAGYEGSYRPLLGGVSQQVARERIEGQVSEQVNMLSDAVTGPRRRPGAQYVYSAEVGYAYQPNAFVAWDTVVGSVRCQVVLDAHQGIIRVYNTANVLVYTSAVIPYLWTTPDPLSLTQSDSNKIQTATVGGEMFFANTGKKPARGAASTFNHAGTGFVWVKAGVFSKKYTVTVTLTSGTVTYSYTTPDGTAPGDAAVSTPEYIAGQLQALIQSGGGVTSSVNSGTGVVYVQATTGSVILTSASGLENIVTSNSGHIRSESDLPPNPGGLFNGWIIATGGTGNKRYYKYNVASDQWLESGDRTSPLTLTNCPIALRNIAGVWDVDTSGLFEGRFAGDDDTDPDPACLEFGITGLASYQGRLVILAGNMVDMSASNIARRLYRSTVTSLLDNDRIGIGSTATTAAQYKHAVQFNRDLLLFSDRNQAFVPGSNAATTPRTAVVLPSTEYSSDMTAKPLQVGRGVMFCAPRSAAYFGLMEQLPSGTSENQYTCNDVTQHLPAYMQGRARFSCASTVSGLVAFGSTVELNVLYTHEYIWDRDEKAQAAWHRWVFPYEISTAYFSGDSIIVLFRHASMLVACRIEPKGNRILGNNLAPFLDIFAEVTVVDRHFTLPAWFELFIPADVDKELLRLSNATGSLAGTAIGLEYDLSVFTTESSFKNGVAYIGFPYESSIVPTAPMRKDSKGVRVTTNKMTVLRFNVSTNKSGAFEVEISDNVPEFDDDDVQSPVYYNSPELTLGAPVVGADSTVVVPARTRAENTVLRMSTDGMSEFNLVGLEFVAQYHEKLQRER